MRISDWSSDVCSSDLDVVDPHQAGRVAALGVVQGHLRRVAGRVVARGGRIAEDGFQRTLGFVQEAVEGVLQAGRGHGCGSVGGEGSEEHTSELQSLMRTSSAVFCLNKKKKVNTVVCS